MLQGGEAYTATTITTTTNIYGSVRDYPDEPVSEKTFTLLHLS